MQTSSKSWRRKANDAWYVDITGQQVMLAEGKVESRDQMKMAEADR
jgi:hypothetical protein